MEDPSPLSSLSHFCFQSVSLLSFPSRRLAYQHFEHDLPFDAVGYRPTDQQFERAIINLLPWRAVSAKQPRNAQFDPETSASFTVNEFIAVRDEPKSWFFLAKITAITETCMIVHYYGCKHGDLKKVKFLPCWHLAMQQHIRLAPNNLAHHIRYTGIVDFSSIPALLVARNLSRTSMSILSSKSRRLLMPIRDEIFTYE
jgi:hypothetical protein